MKLRLIILVLFISSQLISFSFASSLEDQVSRYTLKNGMRFLLVQRKGAPVFAGYIRVKVGGADEESGKTGIAHMLEHMAFKGTQSIGTRNYLKEKKVIEEIETVGIELSKLTQANQNQSPKAKKLQEQLKQLQKKQESFIVKDEFSRAYTQNGASNFNATTSKDVTSYFVELPSSKLELWAYLESERLKDPVFREFYQERDVVQEERRSRVDNSPFGKNYEELLQNAFSVSPYRDPTIGYAKDISALTATDLKKFYETYYVPQNMVGAIVGNFEIDEVKRMLDQYFGSIPAGKNPPQVSKQEPEQTQEKRHQVSFDARSHLMIAYHKPTMPSREDYVFDMIGQVLCEGRSSRLHQSLIEKQKLAQAIGCDASTPGARFNNLFFIYASALGKNHLSEIEKAIDVEIEKMKNTPVTSEELERARKQILADRLFKMKSNLGLAETLTYFEVLAGDWHYLLEHEKTLSEITPNEIQKVAQKYFTSNNKTVSQLVSGK
ncbi:MAG: insulinase family protein [Deltaproteobacteria bacterium]|nr:insulinase family protein [Deltaproteobacteria bacterium]